jgi:galactokinase
VADPSGKVNALAQAFKERYKRAPELFCSAPGRVNLIGEHTDYNAGLALPMALKERTRVAAAKRDDRVIRVYSAALKKERSFSLDDNFTRRGKWLDYVEGVARALLAEGVPVRGADLYIASDVPPGAGLSSSAALELSLGLAFSSLAGQPLAPRALAFAGQKAENEYAGANTGIMDQLVCALARAGHALLIDCRSLQTTEVKLPAVPVAFLVFDTHVRHALAASGEGYNRRREECEQALRLLQQAGWPVSSLSDVSVTRLEEAQRLLPEPLDRRLRHVVRENARTRAAVDALAGAHVAAFGRLMSGSHASLRDDYQVSCPELDHLVELALRERGVLGARMTGGGFGGSALVLAQAGAVEAIGEELAGAFRREFGSELSMYRAEAGDGVRAEDVSRA